MFTHAIACDADLLLVSLGSMFNCKEVVKKLKDRNILEKVLRKTDLGERESFEKRCRNILEIRGKLYCIISTAGKNATNFKYCSSDSWRCVIGRSNIIFISVL